MNDLYLITPSEIEDEEKFFVDFAYIYKNLPVSVVQIRLKASCGHLLSKVKQQAARLARRLKDEFELCVLINDFVDIVIPSGADGVHIGQTDGDLKTVRQILGKDRIIGVTCHGSKHLAFMAAEDGANYVAFGSVFETKTKQVKNYLDLDLIRWWVNNTIVPCVIIGGINQKNIATILNLQADYIAFCSAIWSYPCGVATAVDEFKKLNL